jgi:hypothetical protein
MLKRTIIVIRADGRVLGADAMTADTEPIAVRWSPEHVPVANDEEREVAPVSVVFARSQK